MFCLPPAPSLTSFAPGHAVFLRRLHEALASEPVVRVAQGLPWTAFVSLHPNGWALLLDQNARNNSLLSTRLRLLPLFRRRTPLPLSLTRAVDIWHSEALGVFPLPARGLHAAAWILYGRDSEGLLRVWRVSGERQGRRWQVRAQHLGLVRFQKNPHHAAPVRMTQWSEKAGPTLLTVETESRERGVHIHLTTSIGWSRLPEDPRPRKDVPYPPTRKTRVVLLDRMSAPFTSYLPRLLGFQWPHPDTGLLAMECIDDEGRCWYIHPIIQGRPAPHGFRLPSSPGNRYNQAAYVQGEEYIWFGDFVYHIPTGRGALVAMQPAEAPPQAVSALSDIPLREKHTPLAFPLGTSVRSGRPVFWRFYGNMLLWMEMPTWERPGRVLVRPLPRGIERYARGRLRYTAGMVAWPRCPTPTPLFFREHSDQGPWELHLTLPEAWQRVFGPFPETDADDEITLPLNLEPLEPLEVDIQTL